MRAAMWGACLLVVAAGLFARPADAKRVIMRPAVSRSCPDGKSWDSVASCLKRFGKLTIEHEEGDLKLIRLGGNPTWLGTDGHYLYTQRAGHWRLGGMLEGDAYTLLGFQRIPVGKHETFRIDLASSIPQLMIVNEILRQTRVHQHLALFCSGDAPGCSSVLVACDVYVEGKSYWTFRGALEFAETRIKISGDRSNVGAVCAQDADDFLPVSGDY